MSDKDRPGRTVKRPKNRCRVVVTYEVEIPEGAFASIPSWKRHAMQFLRDMRDQHETADKLIKAMRRNQKLSIISEKVEICS